MLSVIVPIYNADKYLYKCLDSIIDQTYKELDIILVDDGSEDSSGQICDLYAKRDTRIQVIHKKNEGLIKARMTGLEKAKFPYIAFVDSDDWIDLHMYEDLMKPIQNEDVDLVYTSEICWYDSEDFILAPYELESGMYEEKQIKEKIIPYMFGDRETNGGLIRAGLWTKIFKKELLQKRYKELDRQDFFVGEDVAITYPYVLECKKIYVSDIHYYYYRQLPRGEVKKCFKSDNYFDDLYKLYSSLRKIFVQYDNSDILMEQLDYFYMHMTNNYRLKYEGSKITNQIDYKLPCNAIRPGANIAIYGAGRVGRKIHNELIEKGNYKIIYWIDKYYKSFREMGIVSINEIDFSKVEYIILATSSVKTRQIMLEELKKKKISNSIIII